MCIRDRFRPVRRECAPCRTCAAFLHGIMVVIARSMEDHRTKVLVVDDDPEIAQSLGRKLTYVGYDVEIATEPGSIVDRIHTERADWDVVLLDVALPGMSGVDVLKRFRDSGSMASVIMLTGDGSAGTATACLRAGAFHYLPKPCLPIDLASTVESAARHTALLYTSPSPRDS